MKNSDQTLNERQREAVEVMGGALLVLAGPGTGKTTILVDKLYRILQSSWEKEEEVLAMTFCNKAAREIRNRLKRKFTTTISDNYCDRGDSICDSSYSKKIDERLWVGTFHSVAHKVLDLHYVALNSLLGLGSKVKLRVIDEAGSTRVLNNIISKSSDVNISVNQAAKKIKDLKNRLCSYNKFSRSEFVDVEDASIAIIYRKYQEYLIRNHLMDFDDLLLYFVLLMNDYEDLYSRYRSKFFYVLVDEYQDISFAQQAMLNIFAGKDHNICCVGDDDQCIYGWRGAIVSNMLDFEKRYNDPKIIRLSENYRSTFYIINAANNLISNNRIRYRKELSCTKSKGNKINIHQCEDDIEEAYRISHMIDEILKKESQFAVRGYASSIAILTRSTYQMRIIEDNLNLLRIPYTVLGGTNFYERVEIKNIIFYLRLVINKNDNEAFEAVLNVPNRKLGPVTIECIKDFANKRAISLFDASFEICQNYYYKDCEDIKGRGNGSEWDFQRLRCDAVRELKGFIEQIDSWQSNLAGVDSLDLLLRKILDDIRYINYIENRYSGRLSSDNAIYSKLANIDEFLSQIAQFQSLKDYLDFVRDKIQASSYDEDVELKGRYQNIVKIMTIHAAKGLEFDIVFLPGWEEKTTPIISNIEEPEMLEEERRLAYVALTRAKRDLHILFAGSRFAFGEKRKLLSSRFIRELGSMNCILCR